VEAGERVVLPSPNGAALSLQAGEVLTLTACLRNATAVARAAERLGRRITVVPAGERWPSGTLRPAIEDWVGAGAVVAGLGGLQSPEAALARSAFETVAPRLESVLSECSSGRELIDRGYQDDVTWASALDVSQSVPILRRGAFSSLPPVKPAV
jgi:2-phosphosulfolactate phosphatase